MEKKAYCGNFRINYELLGKIIAEKYKRGNLQRYYFNYFCKKYPSSLLIINKKQLN